MGQAPQWAARCAEVARCGAGEDGSSAGSSLPSARSAEDEHPFTATGVMVPPNKVQLQQLMAEKQAEAARQQADAERQGKAASELAGQLAGHVQRLADWHGFRSRGVAELATALQGKVDYLQQVSGDSEAALRRCRLAWGAFREAAAMEKEQLERELECANKELEAARGDAARLRAEFGRAHAERTQLQGQLRRCEREGEEARASCQRLERTRIEEWLLHDRAAPPLS